MKDFLQSLELIGVTARVKRLADSLMYDSRRYYKNSELDIEPNWHIIFLLLESEKELTVTEIAKKMKFSHAAIIKITKRMKEKGYLNSKQDASDSRKTLLRLSNKSLKKLPLFKKEWNGMQAIINDVVDKDFLVKLTEIENKLSSQSISERYIQKKKRYLNDKNE